MAKLLTTPIGILATGDEIVNGDVVNRNGPYLARQLRQLGFQPGLQITVDDDESRILEALQYLLAKHEVVFTLGGLGPTSDDRTRFAVAQMIQQPLTFFDDCWQRIVERLTHLGLPVPDNNRQQCLFPANAQILPNGQGTAAGCYIPYRAGGILLLPGPPPEFQVMLDQHALPKLLEYYKAPKRYFSSWLVLGAGEGQLAAQLDPLWTGQNCLVGYRADSPYVEIKLQSEEESVFKPLEKQFEAILQPFLVSREQKTASHLLKEFIVFHKIPFYLQDFATKNHLLATLTTRETLAYLVKNAPLQIELHGFEAYWQKEETARTSQIQLVINQKTEAVFDILLHRRYTLTFALEMTSWHLLTYLRKNYL